MLTGKQRSYLKGLANPMQAILQIGKEGVTDSFITQLAMTIGTKELVKISILESSADLDVKQTAFMLAERTGSEFVQSIGRKIVLYKEAEEPEKRKIVIPQEKKRRG